MKKNYLSKSFVLLITILSVTISYSQVGIGTTSPNGALDITSTTDGLLIPRVSLTATNVATVTTPTTSELVYNTNTSAAGPNQVTPGFYYWDGALWVRLTTGSSTSNDWTITGNAGTNGGNITTAGTNFIGTTDNQNLDVRTNNTYRARFSALGEFFVGT